MLVLALVLVGPRAHLSTTRGWCCRRVPAAGWRGGGLADGGCPGGWQQHAVSSERMSGRARAWLGGNTQRASGGRGRDGVVPALDVDSRRVQLPVPSQGWDGARPGCSCNVLAGCQQVGWAVCPREEEEEGASN